MTFEETLEINFGTPSIDLINSCIKEHEAINIFYKLSLKNDKRPYWKGKIMNSTKTINRLKIRGIKLYGDKFKPEEMGLTKLELQQIGRSYRSKDWNTLFKEETLVKVLK